MFGSRFTRDEIKRTGADGRRLDSPMIVDDHVESASRHLEYRPNISQWVIDDELNPTSETNFAFIDIPDGYFPRGSRAWTVHSPDARVAVPCGGQYTVTIQVLSAAEVRVAKQHVNAARSNSMGCCICRTPPKDIFSLESRVGLQALNANGILAKYCHENLPLNDAKGMRVVHVRGRRTIWLRMIRLDPPLTDAQVIGAPGRKQSPSVFVLSSLSFSCLTILAVKTVLVVKTQWPHTLWCLWLSYQSWRHCSRALTWKQSTCKATRSPMMVQ